MKQKTKEIVRKTLKAFGVGITSYANLQELIKNERTISHLRNLLEIEKKSNSDILFLSQLPDEQIPIFLKNLLKESKSQIRQDLFVLSESGLKKQGFFVDFGATDGVSISNTYLLEKWFDWRGIVAEPAECWHAELRKNRNCYIETRCVWKESDSTLYFNEVEFPELSTIDRFSANDMHKEERTKGKLYEVQTISLLDLLEYYNAPRVIDYLSVDTEGSEFDILSSFDFAKFEFKVITCEHNFTPMREKIHALLTSHGYVRKFEDLSYFDDWYVKA